MDHTSEKSEITGCPARIRWWLSGEAETVLTTGLFCKSKTWRNCHEKIADIGPGCPKCIELAKRTEEAARAAGVDYELEKVSELNKIMSFGVFTTPALVVDGEVKAVGKVPSVDEIKKMIQ